MDLAYDRAKISTLIDQILENAQTLGYGSSAIFAIRLAIEEAITNAFEHGHEGLDPSTTVCVEYLVNGTSSPSNRCPNVHEHALI